MLESNIDIQVLLGKTMQTVTNIDNEKIILITTDNKVFELYHEQD